MLVRFSWLFRLLFTSTTWIRKLRFSPSLGMFLCLQNSADRLIFPTAWGLPCDAGVNHRAGWQLLAGESIVLSPEMRSFMMRGSVSPANPWGAVSTAANGARHMGRKSWSGIGKIHHPHQGREGRRKDCVYRQGLLFSPALH